MGDLWAPEAFHSLIPVPFDLWMVGRIAGSTDSEGAL